MTRFLRLVSFFFFIIISASADELYYNVLDYGAKADAKTVNTKYIQKAIDDCSKNGGVVLFPSGKYLTGTIYLKDNVTLQLQKGAKIIGSTDLRDYPENNPDYQFLRKGKIKRSLIYAEQCKNISIIGEGTIDGQGGKIITNRGKPVKGYAERPHVIWMIKSKNIKIDGVKLQNSSLWMQHYIGCEKLRIQNIEIFNHSNKNNDMMDINGCKDVVISNVIGDSDDDGITLKSSHEMPCENITITNCVLSSHCNAIKCGTESNAGFKNITISNCVIRPSKEKSTFYGIPGGVTGISLEVVDGGNMNGVTISNIVMDSVLVPIFIRLGDRARGYDNNLPKPSVGTIENIHLSNITAFNTSFVGSSITGIPGHAVKNITLDNIRIYGEGGRSLDEVKAVIPELEEEYPSAEMFGILPAYGFYIRHAENVTLNNVELYFNKADKRPAISLDDVSRCKISHLQADIDEASTLIYGNDIQDIYIQNPWLKGKCSSLLEVKGEKSEDIILTDVDRLKFNKFVERLEGVSKEIIRIGNTF